MTEFNAEQSARADVEHSGVFDITDSPVASEFYFDRNRVTYIQGAFGTGKTVTSVQKAVQLANEQEPNQYGQRKSRIAVVRNTYAQLVDTTIRTWLDWFPAPAWGNFIKSNNTYDMAWGLEDGTTVSLEVWFRGLDRPDQVSNLLGGEYSMCFFNEARHISIEIFEAMDGRIGRYPPMKDGVGCTFPCIFMDSNPPDEDHWLYRVFEMDRIDGYKAFYQPSGLSPEAENLKNLPKDYYQNLAKGKDDYFINVYVHGKYGYLRSGKPVYPAYNDDVHCKEIEALARQPLYIGIDFGLTPSCVICQRTAEGILLVLDEITSERMGIKQFIDVMQPYLAEKYAGHVVEGYYCDPAGAQSAQTDATSPYDVMYDAGIIPEDGLQNPELRIESVTNLLNKMIDGKPAIMISYKAKMLRKGFSGAYHYRRLNVSKERYVDRPDKNEYSHIHDALQYLCTRLYGTATYHESGPVKVIGGLDG